MFLKSANQVTESTSEQQITACEEYLKFVQEQPRDWANREFVLNIAMLFIQYSTVVNIIIVMILLSENHSNKVSFKEYRPQPANQNF